MKLTQIGHEVELDNLQLEGHLRFLYDRCLVGEQNIGEDEWGYFVTERGSLILKVMGPLVSEAQRIQARNFEVISNALSEANITPGEVVEKKSKRKIFDLIKRKTPKWRLSDFIKVEIEKIEE